MERVCSSAFRLPCCTWSRERSSLLPLVRLQRLQVRCWRLLLAFTSGALECRWKWSASPVRTGFWWSSPTTENAARSSHTRSAERGRGISCYTGGSRGPHTSRPSTPLRWKRFGRPGLHSFPGIRSNSRRRDRCASPWQLHPRDQSERLADLPDRGLVGEAPAELARRTSFSARYARRSFTDRPTTPTSGLTRVAADTGIAPGGGDIL